MRFVTRLLGCIGIFVLISHSGDAQPVDEREEGSASYHAELVADGLNMPWGLAFLPNGDLLVTELGGQLRIVRNGKLVGDAVLGVPPVYRAGQGGLMDVVLHPDFEQNGLIYLSLAVGSPNANALRVVRATFSGQSLENPQTVFEAAPSKDTAVHYGGRMTFLPDHSLLITVGDGFDYREQAQNKLNHFGSIVRVTDDGKVPADNPFATGDGGQPEIWSYGHRNPQGIAYDSGRKVVWASEHGPRGGDELNLIEAARNYGWPAITYGLDYSGGRISPFTAYEGMEQPVVYWTPSIGPSGLAVYNGDAFPQWQGDIFLPSLVFKHVRRVEMDGMVAVDQEILFSELGGRVRDVRIGPDGLIYLLLEGDGETNTGRIMRISPRS